MRQLQQIVIIARVSLLFLRPASQEVSSPELYMQFQVDPGLECRQFTVSRTTQLVLKVCSIGLGI